MPIPPFAFSTFLIPTLLATSLSAAAGLPGAGQASGSFTVNGQTIEIHHAYARAAPHDGGLRHFIVLTDVPVEAELLNDHFKMWDRSREGKLHYQLIERDPDGAANRKITLYHPDLGSMGYMSTGAEGYEFEEIVLTAERIEARAYMTEPMTGFDNAWLYDVKFTASIRVGETW